MKKQLVIIGMMLVLLIVGLSGCNDLDLGEVTQFSITNFTVKPSMITKGETANLSWVVMSAQTVSIDNGIGNVSNIGDRIITPTETTVYTLTAVNGTKTITATTEIFVSENSKNDITNPDNESEDEDDTNEGRWLFAMDVQSEDVGGYAEYHTGYIPTSIIIDIDGNIVHKSAGVHSKDELIQHVEEAKHSLSGRTQAPTFSLETIGGNQFKLSDYQGTPIILDLMAVRCPPCHQQMPELQKVKKELGDDIVILSIDVDGAGGYESEQDVIDAFGEYIRDE